MVEGDDGVVATVDDVDGASVYHWSELKNIRVGEYFGELE